MMGLTVLEAAIIDKLRARMAEFGYPVDSVPTEALAAAAVRFRKMGVDRGRNASAVSAKPSHKASRAGLGAQPATN